MKNKIVKQWKKSWQHLEAELLLNNEVKVTSSHSQFYGSTGMVNRIMPDGRTLEVDFGKAKVAFIDVTLVSEIHEPVEFAKGEPDLGSIANSVVQSGK